MEGISMRKIMLLGSLLTIALLWMNCATILSGTTDKIMIESEPDGAKILIDGLEYGRTPATITVKRDAFQDKQVVLKLEGYEQRVFILQKDFNAIAILNLGSLVGWAVDFASGAVMEYSPRYYSIELTEKKAPHDIKSLPQDEEGRLLVPDDKERVSIVDPEKELMVVFEKRK
jgi:hypothetical protein